MARVKDGFIFVKCASTDKNFLGNLGQVDTDVEKLMQINMKFKVSLPKSSFLWILNEGQVQQHFCSFGKGIFILLLLFTFYLHSS